MKITRFILSDHNQFKYLNIDLTYPKGHPTKEGKALDKICFIGKNGTGKTSILKFVKEIIKSIYLGNGQVPNLKKLNVLTGQDNKQFALEFEIEDKRYLIGNFIKWNSNNNFESRGILQLCTAELYKNDPDFFEKVFVLKDPNTVELIFNENDKLKLDNNNRVSLAQFNYVYNKSDFLTYSPTEYRSNQSFQELSTLSTLNQALNFGKNISFYHEISFDTIQQFWSLLVYQVQQRERERYEFENRDENLKKTKEELIESFDKKYPEILKVISEKWKIILDEVGLYFDAENAKKPIVLDDHLNAYIKVKGKEREIVSYGELSSGIKNLLLMLGYLKSLYFHRDIKSVISLFDEPEFSLFPDILLKLVDIYTDPKDFPNTQFLFATHSPLIATQFEPSERICLHFDENRKVYYSRGIAALGDDPNDLLSKDFQLTSILPKEGDKAFKKYLDLQAEIKFEEDPKEKEKLVSKFLELGAKYNFGNEKNH